MRAVLIAVGLLLGGCAAQVSETSIDATDDARCVDMGTVKGTPAYTNCRLTLSNQRAYKQTEAYANRPGGVVGALIPPPR